MKANMTLMCSKCGKRFKAGNTNGMANGFGFMMDDGTLINVCQKCMIELGSMGEEEMQKFFAESAEIKE